MFCVNPVRRLCLVILLGIGLSACNNLTDDLAPSSSDKRGDVVSGTVGSRPGQIAADFSISDSLGNTFTLTDHLSGGSQPADAIVLYFTMWCPICLSHTDHMLTTVIPQFNSRGTVVYGLVDYVSGSVTLSRATEVANGYGGSAFTTLVDIHQSLMDQFNAAMGTVVVIAADGTILLNEDYRNSIALQDALDQLLP